MKREVRVLNGYRVIYEPGHPRAMTSYNWKGYVYEHVFVAEKSLGREIRPGEAVHHLDGNKGNNRSSNLLVLDSTQHGKLHAWVESGAPWEDNVTACEYCVCGRTLQIDQAKFCSNTCAGSSRRKAVRPTKKELEKDLAHSSWTSTGRKYGVSDNAVRKWAKQYSIEIGT